MSIPLKHFLPHSVRDGLFCIQFVHTAQSILYIKRCYIKHKKQLIMINITVAEGSEKSSHNDSDTSPSGAGQKLLPGKNWVNVRIRDS